MKGTAPISFAGGGSVPIEFEQEIGWRTEDYLVIGQIVATNAHDGDAPSLLESIPFRAAITHDIALIPPGTRDALIAAPFTNAMFAMVEAAFWAITPHTLTPQGPFSSGIIVGIGTVTEPHRYWMVQTGLNGSVDSPTAPTQIADTALPGTVTAEQYRILHQYQVKFTLTAEGKIDKPAIKTVSNVAAVGPTKINALTIPAGTFSSVGWDNPVLGPAPASEKSPHNKKTQTSEDLTQHSGFASGRVGADGQNVNWRIFGQDVPWIFSEIVCQVNPDRSVESRIYTSVDIAWQDGEIVEGIHNFNNLNIYKATLTSETGVVNYVRQPDGLLEMNNQVKPFIESVPPGTWPTPPIEPFVQ